MRTRKEEALYEEVKRFGDALNECRTELDITKAKSGRRKKALKALNRSYLIKERESLTLQKEAVRLHVKLQRTKYDADAYRATYVDLKELLDASYSESLEQSKIIGEDIDCHDKLIMENRGLEVKLERANALLERVEGWLELNEVGDPPLSLLAEILAKRKG